jgi:mRNA interferase RelE/StbE
MTGQPWSIEFSPGGRKDLDRLDPQVRRRIYTALQRIAADPRQATGVRKLTGLEEWRIRVGAWRVRFAKDGDTQTIYITRILPRGRAYDR